MYPAAVAASTLEYAAATAPDALLLSRFIFPNDMSRILSTTNPSALVLLIAFVVGFMLFLLWGAQGAADFDEMLHDVAAALAWVEKHKHTDLLSLQANKKNSMASEPPVVTVILVWSSLMS